MIAGIQIIGIIFTLVMIYLTYVYYKRKNYGYKSMLLWLAVWIGILVLIARPAMVYGVMEILEIERTADFFVMSGFAVFSIIIFYMYVLVKRSSVRVEELVRLMAIEHKTQNKKTKKKK